MTIGFPNLPSVYFPGIAPSLPIVTGCSKINTLHSGSLYAVRHAMNGKFDRTDICGRSFSSHWQEMIFELRNPLVSFSSILLRGFNTFGPILYDNVSAGDYYMSLNYNLLKVPLQPGEEFDLESLTYANANYSEQLTGGTGTVSALYGDPENYKAGGVLFQHKFTVGGTVHPDGKAFAINGIDNVPAYGNTLEGILDLDLMGDTRGYHIINADEPETGGPFFGIHFYVAFGANGDQYNAAAPGSYGGGACIDQAYTFSYPWEAQVEHD